MKQILHAIAATLLTTPALAQDASTDTAGADDSPAGGQLLGSSELDTLVGPVALYPDTLLIQILIAATAPLDVVKADRILDADKGAGIDTIKADLAEESLDESVTVLATAFPDVVKDMSDHLEWTQTMGDAMNAQEDDVMAAVQRMRTEAVGAGALVTTPEQSVKTDDANNVVIVPTDPQTVYVPSYDPNVVYRPGSGVSDALMAGAIGFGTFAVMDAIFDDDDDWDNYWGCGHCAGWGGGPVIRDPDIRIDGNVIAGNDIRFDDTAIGQKIRDRDADIGWKPDSQKRQAAKDRIARHRGPDGKTKLPVRKDASRGAELQKRLNQTDHAALRSTQDRPQIRPPASRNHSEGLQKIRKKAPSSGASKAAVHRPSGAAHQKRPTSAKKIAAKPRVSSALQKRGSGRQVRAHAAHARPKAGKLRRR
ncbi:DUF3300 domain-containing protein [Paracoccus marinaquae]|uniref:DUF3300 domain-containing protein n=1 Tax=Paracoccus marinaquae TaxID=2841926 RepID=A0ABS6AME2_9RHOB|nr:DUF3300 domain-containing protein [Paracoccus marinaquae]MBU3031754.1 DUF3300 domain-containing protein [Paracoccus marinaquae]